MLEGLDNQQSMAEVAVEPFAPADQREALIAAAVEAMRGPEIEIRVGPMSTVVVGRFADIVHAVERAHRAVAADAERVVTTLRIESRQGGTDALERDHEARAMEPGEGEAPPSTTAW